MNFFGCYNITINKNCQKRTPSFVYAAMALWRTCSDISAMELTSHVLLESCWGLRLVLDLLLRLASWPDEGEEGER